MNTTLETIAALAQGIIDATNLYPEQYAQKIEELAATIISVAAMAEGHHTNTIDARNLQEGRNDLGNGIIAYRNGDQIKLEKE